MGAKDEPGLFEAVWDINSLVKKRGVRLKPSGSPRFCHAS